MMRNIISIDLNAWNIVENGVVVINKDNLIEAEKKDLALDTQVWVFITNHLIPEKYHEVKNCKDRYAVLFQIWTLPSKPEDEAHIGPTATYDKVIYPGFQHDITALQIKGYNISYNRHTSA